MPLNRDVIRNGRQKAIETEIARAIAEEPDPRDLAFAAQVLARRSERFYWGTGILWTAMTVIVALFAVGWTAGEVMLSVVTSLGFMLLGVVSLLAISVARSTDSLLNDIADKEFALSAVKTAHVVVAVGRWRMLRMPE